jgi:hypothetical protein
MECQRCNGFMVHEKFYGPGDPFWGWKCIRCGEIIDPLILDNRNGNVVRDKRKWRTKRNGRR